MDCNDYSKLTPERCIKKETRSRVEQISVRSGHLITLNNNGEKYEDRTYYDKTVY